MTVSIEINNPHYRRNAEEMAQAVGITVETLFAGIVEHAIDEYAANVEAFKANDVMFRLPESLQKDIRERGVE